jgi:Tol biopolymer transport system component
MWRFVFIFSCVLIAVSGSLAFLRQEPSTASWIVYVGDGQILRMHPDGSNIKSLIPGSGYSNLTLSDTSNNIAFVTSDKKGDALYRSHLFDTDIELVDTQQQIHRSSWSPDGDKLAYIALVDEQSQLFIDSVQRSDQAGMLVASPSWSPDNKSILVLERILHSRRYMQRYNVESAEYSRLIEVSFNMMTSPAYSPDGSHIAYIGPDRSHLMTVSADGTHVTQLTDNLHVEGELLWTSNGEVIVFSVFRRQDNTRNLLKIRHDGTGLEQLTEVRGRVIPYDISPDNEWVVASVSEFEDPAHRKLYRVHLKNGNVQRIPVPTRLNFTPSWSGPIDHEWHPLQVAFLAFTIGAAGLMRSNDA